MDELFNTPQPPPPTEPEEPTPNEGIAIDPEDIDEAPLPGPLKDVDPQKLAEMREKIKGFLAKRGATVSGSEDPDSAPVDPEQELKKDTGEPTEIRGADIDWSEFDLQFGLKHLYPQAVRRETPEGPRWVVMLDDFYTTEKPGRSHGKKVNVPGREDAQEPLNLGEYLAHVVNGPEGWNLRMLLPGQSGQVCAVFHRQLPYVLPEPERLRHEEEVEIPQSEELAAVEDAALKYAEEVAPEQKIEPGTLERLALEVNEGLTEPAPVPTGIQPEPIITETGQRIAPGIENIRRGLPNVLNGEDF